MSQQPTSGTTGGAPDGLAIGPAADADAAELAALRIAVAEDLTRRHGKGHWSHPGTEAGALQGIQTSTVLVARRGAALVGSVRLTTRKPWAIAVEYFTPIRTPIYLIDMAVAPAEQRRGIGRRLLAAAEAAARERGAEAIRLDAYDTAAGAGEFYRKAGYADRGRGVFRGTPHRYYERLLGPAGVA